MTTGNAVVTGTTKDTPAEKVKVLMSIEHRKLLKELYLLRSYSGFEEPIRKGIMNFLDALKIPYINYNGNIIGINHPGKPLFSAHMDMVNTENYKLKHDEYRVDKEQAVFTIDDKACIRLYRDKEKTQQTSLGADDKNGIWVILTLLQMGKEINFAFCHSEETGGTGSQQVISDKEIAELITTCSFGIVIDRRNAHDIIGYSNEYCLALDDKLESFAKEHGFGFKCASGSVSDADRFSKLIECVNLSCGYYDPHTSKEYTNLNELWNTLIFCVCILDRFYYDSVSPERIQRFKKCSSPYSTGTTKTVYAYGSSAYSGKTTTTTSYAFGGTSSEKKKTEKTKMTGTKATGATSTDIKKKLKEEDALTSENALELALYAGAYYDEELDCYIIPLYTDDDIPSDISGKDIITYIDCPNCGRKVAILSNSIDSLFMQYYNIKQDKKDIAVGICSQCAHPQEVTKVVTELVSR